MLKLLPNAAAPHLARQRHPPAPGRWDRRHQRERGPANATPTRAFHTNVVYADFDDFWDSNTISGPAGRWVRDIAPETRELLRARSREQVPIAADGSIRYEVFANAVKGRVPA